jgi:hypothetical protein
VRPSEYGDSAIFAAENKRRILIASAAKEKTVELPLQQQQKHVVSTEMVPVFIVPLKPETRVHERTVTR